MKLQISKYPHKDGFPSGRGSTPAHAAGPGLAENGFTLLEVLVSLIIGMLIIGAVIGMISVSMQHRYRLKEKRQTQPVLESAAQMILADPRRALDGSIEIPELPGSPVVTVSRQPVNINVNEEAPKFGELDRIMLDYKKSQLEFSVIIPNKGTP